DRGPKRLLRRVRVRPDLGDDLGELLVSHTVIRSASASSSSSSPSGESMGLLTISLILRRSCGEIGNRSEVATVAASSSSSSGSSGHQVLDGGGPPPRATAALPLVPVASKDGNAMVMLAVPLIAPALATVPVAVSAAASVWLSAPWTLTVPV